MVDTWKQLGEEHRQSLSVAIDELVALVNTAAPQPDIEKKTQEVFDYFTLMYSDAIFDIREQEKAGHITEEEADTFQQRIQNYYTQEAAVFAKLLYDALNQNDDGRRE